MRDQLFPFGYVVRRAFKAFGLVDLAWCFNDWNDECTLILIVRAIFNGAVSERLGCLSVASGVAA